LPGSASGRVLARGELLHRGREHLVPRARHHHPLVPFDEIAPGLGHVTESGDERDHGPDFGFAGDDVPTARDESMPEKDMERELKRVEKEMLDAARNLEFERAAQLRDRLAALKAAMFGVAVPDET